MTETTKREKKHKNKKIGRIIVICLIVLILLELRAYYKKGISPVSPDNPVEISVNIPMGSSTVKIANILKDEGLINNKFIFRYIVKNDGLDGKLKAGEYTLNTGMSVEEITETLSHGGRKDNVVKFTIPEGFELKQIAKRLSEMGLVDEERFLALAKDAANFEDKYDFLKELPKGQTLEGLLFPDTYNIVKDATEEEVIEKMLDRFEEVYRNSIKDKVKDSGLSLNEIVTLASIVEREAKVDEERPIVSAVFLNRLDKDMLLESCATVQYALGERKEKLTYDDLKIKSDYNTYIHRGLPPGPIASPGLKSLEATLNPADVDYLFFVSNGDGTHTFTNNFKDHIDAKNKK